LSTVWGFYHSFISISNEIKKYNDIKYLEVTKMEKKIINEVSEWLVIVGGLNWGFSVFNYNLVEKVLPAMIVPYMYGIVGIAAVWIALTKFGVVKQ
jgi:uncharacterized membrane protein YuzA (DUF378 family)